MTLYEYLAAVKPDYTNPALGMVVTKSEVTQHHYDLSKGRPFVQVAEGNVRVVKRMNQGVLFQRFIDVRIWQGPNPDGSTPNMSKITAVWNAVAQAQTSVDSATYDDDLVSFKVIGGFSPHHDITSGGLAALVQFVATFGRLS